jgi:hypothetical protein
LEAFWFKGREISFAMSIDTSLSNIGTALNDYIQPKLYSASHGLNLGMWVGVVTCIFSLFGGFGTFYVDRHREYQDKNMVKVFFQL